MKAMDIIKDEPRTGLESWERKLNWMQSTALTSPFSTRRKITVTSADMDEEYPTVWTPPTESSNQAYTDDEFGSDAQAERMARDV